ncbi:UrcA family protein [Parerythrobacter aurantius]|uniref:UrcA family protein n=1 Tax=Parerythrobacter aurantius TaxID=3127706 RepID=UPI00325178A8
MNKPAILIAAALAVFTVPAVAGEATTITVRTGDLDLNKASDLDRLDLRINRAIRSACGTGSRRVEDIRAEQACRATLRNAAEVEVRLAVSAAREQRLAVLSVSNQG